MPDVTRKIELTQCPACGYALTGLPAAWRCPECGFAYDDRTFVLAGIPRGTTNMTPVRKWLWIFLAIGGAFGPGLLSVAFIGGSGLTALILVSLWVGLLVFLLTTGKSERRGVQQLIFAAGGFGYCRKLSESEAEGDCLISWDMVGTVRIDRKGSQWHRLRIGLMHNRSGPPHRTRLDVGIRCDAETAQWLHQVLNERIRAAREQNVADHTDSNAWGVLRVTEGQDRIEDEREED